MSSPVRAACFLARVFLGESVVFPLRGRFIARETAAAVSRAERPRGGESWCSAGEWDPMLLPGEFGGDWTGEVEGV